MFPHRLVSCILSCIIFVLLVSVHIGAGWVTFITAAHPFDLGLWLTCSEETCSYLNIGEDKMDFIRTFMLIPVLTSLIAILCSADCRYLENCTKAFSPKAQIAAFCNIMSGVFVFLALVAFKVRIHESKHAEKPHPHAIQWAFYTSCVICILSFLTGIYDLILYKLSLWETPTPASEDSPASGESPV